MKHPKYKIGSKVKIANEYRGNVLFTKVIGVVTSDIGYHYFLDSRENCEFEEDIEIPTDYELGTYY